MTSGTLVGLMALVLHRKPLLNFPISLGVALLGLLAPYFFLDITAYAPRFSIHLLPLALLSLMFLVDKLLNGFKFPLKFNWKRGQLS